MLPLVLVAAPWPDAHVVLVPANPASFHTSTTGFTAASIARGQTLYGQHCVTCHGADGRGQGQLASAQPVWPPNLTGPLLWRRADGDVLWHILHGMRDRHRVLTMPGFEPRLGVDDAWALIDFMKAQAAGETLRVAGFWAQPIGLPDVTVRCEGQPARALASWRGQRVRVVADGAVAPALFEDPRFVTVLLRSDRAPAAHASAACVADGPEAWAAFALVAGTGQLAGMQLLSDRDGWLRARGQPGKSSWSDEDLLCRSTDAPRATAGPMPADGLTALIALMDAEPVRFVKGGFVH
jgi:mono/diheme cytochrome c family protein